jgi:hypothetical protein
LSFIVSIILIPIVVSIVFIHIINNSDIKSG